MCDGVFSIGGDALYLNFLLDANTLGDPVLIPHVLSPTVTRTVGKNFPEDPHLIAGFSMKETALDSVFDIEFEVDYATQGWLPFASGN